MNLNWELDITPEKINRSLSESHLLIEIIIIKVKNREKTSLQLLPTGGKRLAYLMMNVVWYINEKSNHKLNFVLDENSCIGCGICAKVCTTKRIRMHDNKPKWIHNNCSFCYACFNYCPTQSIGVKHYTKKLGRYHHPDISVDDIAQQTK